MPKMDQGNDSEAYLEAFERLAMAAGWAPEHWAYQLGPFLLGRAQVAYRAMP